MGGKAIAVIAVILGLAVGAYVFLSSDSLEKETSGTVMEDIIAISESWSGEALKSRADPGLIKAMGSQGQSAEELLKIYSALGKLKQPPRCKVQSTNLSVKAGVQHTFISYECSAEYEKGAAVISLTLSKPEKETQWLIYYINIRSDIFGADIIE